MHSSKVNAILGRKIIKPLTDSLAENDRALFGAWCHGHAHPGHVAHGRMPMTSQTLVMSFHSSVFPFVILGRMTPQKYHV